MKAVRMLKSQKGFSLIELMIVVAIIGILATVAVPNFTRFQAKARQSSGKSMLAGYYSAQKATYSEFQYFPGNFPGAGYKPEGQLTYRLTAADNAVVLPLGFNPADTFAGCLATSVAATTANCGLPYNGSWTELPNAQVVPGATCVAAAAGTVGQPGSFIACASSNIGSTTVDVWSMNQLKVLASTQNGLP